MTQLPLPIDLPTDPQLAAQKDLARDVRKRRNSYAIQSFAKHHAAGKLGWQRRQGVAQ